MKALKSECAKCGIKDKICRSLEGQGPAFCPTLHQKEVVGKANKEYTKPDLLGSSEQPFFYSAELKRLGSKKIPGAEAFFSYFPIDKPCKGVIHWSNHLPTLQLYRMGWKEP
jgi:hypothetical protein